MKKKIKVLNRYRVRKLVGRAKLAKPITNRSLIRINAARQAYGKKPLNPGEELR